MNQCQIIDPKVFRKVEADAIPQACLKDILFLAKEILSKHFSLPTPNFHKEVIKNALQTPPPHTNNNSYIDSQNSAKNSEKTTGRVELLETMFCFV